MSAICLIPARGGSKRIKRKNLKEFAGKPIIAYAIAAAQEAGVFSRVIVSTDDAEIAEVAKLHGAETPFMRPAEFSNDMATTADVIRHCAEWLTEHDQKPESICCLYPTSVFVALNAQDLVQAHNQLVEKKVKVVMPCIPTSCCIWRTFKRNDDGHVKMFWPENFPKRTQDLPEAWVDPGQFYFVNVDWYLREPVFFSDDTLTVPMPMHVMDIDTPEDWDIAEIVFIALRDRKAAKTAAAAAAAPAIATQ